MKLNELIELLSKLDKEDIFSIKFIDDSDIKYIDSSTLIEQSIFPVYEDRIINVIIEFKQKLL